MASLLTERYLWRSGVQRHNPKLEECKYNIYIYAYRQKELPQAF